MNIVGIVAVGRNGEIGRGGAIPWHYPADLRFFKEQTTGHACVMGRRTWLSLKKPLPNRLNIVMTRSAEVAPQESVLVVRDKVSVLSLRPYLRCDLFVVGGEQVYRAFRDEIDRWIVTRVPLDVPDADTLMPADFLEGFRRGETRQIDAGLRIEFYERISASG